MAEAVVEELVAVILFDAATARDLLDALRLYEGRLQGSGRQLSRGVLELRAAAEVSVRVSKDQPPASPPPEAHDGGVLDLLTYADVAARLQVSQATVKRMGRDGRLPVVRIGTAVRVRPADLESYIASVSKESA